MSSFTTIMALGILFPFFTVFIRLVVFLPTLLGEGDSCWVWNIRTWLPVLVLVQKMIGGDEVVRVIVVTLGEGIFQLFGEFSVSTTVTLMDKHRG